MLYLLLPIYLLQKNSGFSRNSYIQVPDFYTVIVTWKKKLLIFQLLSDFYK